MRGMSRSEANPAAIAGDIPRQIAYRPRTRHPSTKRHLVVGSELNNTLIPAKEAASATLGE